jgi:hypothetical protein
MISTSRRLRRRTHRRGSAFIISLLVIVVITFLGLTLSMITTTEMQLGGNDRDMQRATFSAESGLAVTAARILVRQDTLAPEYAVTPQPLLENRPIQINEFASGTDSTPGKGSRVILSSVAPLNNGPAAYSQINNRQQYDNKAQDRIIVGYTAWGYRYDSVYSPTPTSPDIPTTVRALSTVLDFQPGKAPLNLFYSLAGNTGGRPPIP